MWKIESAIVLNLYKCRSNVEKIIIESISGKIVATGVLGKSMILASPKCETILEFVLHL